jgi:hypothetical protein
MGKPSSKIHPLGMETNVGDFTSGLGLGSQAQQRKIDESIPCPTSKKAR